jgi:hypothetical protein
MIVPYGGVLRRSNLPANPCLANFLASPSRPWTKSMTSPTDAPPSPDGETHASHSKLASAIERGIFASRWLLAPMYLGLAVSLQLLLGKFVQETVELARHTGTEDVHKLITGILSLVDLSLAICW